MMKQVIVLRKDLNMPIGKACAQAAHASVKVVVNGIENPTLSHDFAICYEEWIATGATKICLAVDSYDALKKIEEEANKLGLINSGVITDEGRTVFEGYTSTCLAIGPANSSTIDKVTKQLKLF